MSATCPRCKRGREACQYCHNIAREDWEAICDCGLYDFGYHLSDCEARAVFRFVIAADWQAATEPRSV